MKCSPIHSISGIIGQSMFYQYYIFGFDIVIWSIFLFQHYERGGGVFVFDNTSKEYMLSIYYGICILAAIS